MSIHGRIGISLAYMPVYNAGYLNAVLAEHISKSDRIEGDIKYDDVVDALKKYRVDVTLAPKPKPKE